MSKTRIAAIIGAVTLGLGLLACGSGGNEKGLTVPTDTATTATVTKAAPTKPVSTEQKNANAAAASYLDGQSFSRTGLIKQLEFDGYPAKVSTVAVDSQHTDWNEQAALHAKSYLDGQSFSRKSLISQLEFDGFTHAQAVYGVSKTGL
jgi:hypothetical protein